MLKLYSPLAVVIPDATSTPVEVRSSMIELASAVPVRAMPVNDVTYAELLSPPILVRAGALGDVKSMMILVVNVAQFGVTVVSQSVHVNV